MLPTLVTVGSLQQLVNQIYILVLSGANAPSCPELMLHVVIYYMHKYNIKQTNAATKYIIVHCANY